VTPVLVFDIETVPDVAGLRRLHPQWAALDDAAVAEAAFAQRREASGSDFLQHHLHRVVAIGCVFRDAQSVRVRCLGNHDDAEPKLIADFFKLIDRYTPQLVSWNGGGFDLPVLHYRGLMHGVSAPRYWELGEDDRDFKWNNYVNRYHLRHLDLMDLLALYQPRASAPLDALAKLAGFAGKLGMDGAQVWPAFRAGRIDEIRAYCETDVVNTYLLYCRFQKMRGLLDESAYAAEIKQVRDTLAAAPGAHWREYLDAWPSESVAPAA
jgi:predicted PolB exonuclease-like 3'-5' exonuclease